VIKKALILATILLSIAGLGLVIRSSLGSSECTSAQAEDPPGVAISPEALAGWADFVQQLKDYGAQQEPELEGGAAGLSDPDVSGLTRQDWVVIVDQEAPAVGGVALLPDVECL
jgi:hypothetical protein